MAVSKEHLNQIHKKDMAHFGEAEAEAYRLGAQHHIENVAFGASDKVQHAFTDAQQQREYVASNREFVNPETKMRWHSPGSLAMYTLFGHSDVARQLADAVDVAIGFAVEQAFLQQAQEAERLQHEAEERECRYQEHAQLFLDGTSQVHIEVHGPEGLDG